MSAWKKRALRIRSELNKDAERLRKMTDDENQRGAYSVVPLALYPMLVTFWVAQAENGKVN